MREAADLCFRDTLFKTACHSQDFGVLKALLEPCAVRVLGVYRKGGASDQTVFGMLKYASVALFGGDDQPPRHNCLVECAITYEVRCGNWKRVQQMLRRRLFPTSPSAAWLDNFFHFMAVGDHKLCMANFLSLASPEWKAGRCRNLDNLFNYRVEEDMKRLLCGACDPPVLHELVKKPCFHARDPIHAIAKECERWTRTRAAWMHAVCMASRACGKKSSA